jgi:acetylornithine aminotransferase
MERVFFCNSGAEANEAAIKIARLVGHKRDNRAPHVIVVENSFHGRTLGTLTATGNRKVQAGFEPLLTGFVRAPFDDVAAIETIAENNESVVAILVEPIQGEAGIVVPKPGYLTALRRICDRRGWLLMLDEVQTGNGRTGRYFAYQHDGILPDVVTTAKGLGNGVPIGACLARGVAAEAFRPGNHGSTFGGNPLACAAGLAVIDALEKDGLMARAATLGERMLARLRKSLAGDNRVVDIRGCGLMLGIELANGCGDLVKRGLATGLLVNVTHDRVIRLLPPLVLTDAEADTIVDGVVSLIRETDAPA